MHSFHSYFLVAGETNGKCIYFFLILPLDPFILAAIWFMNSKYFDPPYNVIFSYVSELSHHVNVLYTGCYAHGFFIFVFDVISVSFDECMGIYFDLWFVLLLYLCRLLHWFSCLLLCPLLDLLVWCIFVTREPFIPCFLSVSTFLKHYHKDLYQWPCWFDEVF